MRKIIIFVLFLIAVLGIPVRSMAQQGNAVIIQFPGVPSGACSPVSLGLNTATGDFYDCSSGTWNLVGGAASGTVKSVATSSPLSGGTITSTGTLSCPTCTVTLDTTQASLDEEFLSATGTNDFTSSNASVFNFEMPWVFYFNCTSAGNQLLGANANGSWPAIGIATLTGCSSAASGDKVGMGLGSNANGTITQFGALASNTGWTAKFRVKLDSTTNNVVRFGFCNDGGSLSATLMCDEATSGHYLIIIRYDTSQSDAGFLGETCSSTSCSQTSSTLCAADTSFHTFTISLATAGTMSFQCDSGTVRTTTTNLPTGISMAAYVWNETLTTVGRTTQVDFFKFQATGLSR